MSDANRILPLIQLVLQMMMGLIGFLLQAEITDGKCFGVSNN
jgi:hypothetical protein